MRKNTISRTSRQVPNRQLSEAEAERIAEKLAVSLEHDSDDIAMLLLLIGHFEQCREDFGEFESAVAAIKRALFTGTCASDDALTQFEAQAVASRTNLLMWPGERKVA